MEGFPAAGRSAGPSLRLTLVLPPCPCPPPPTCFRLEQLLPHVVAHWQGREEEVRELQRVATELSGLSGEAEEGAFRKGGAKGSGMQGAARGGLGGQGQKGRAAAAGTHVRCDAVEEPLGALGQLPRIVAGIEGAGVPGQARPSLWGNPQRQRLRQDPAEERGCINVTELQQTTPVTNARVTAAAATCICLQQSSLGFGVHLTGTDDSCSPDSTTASSCTSTRCRPAAHAQGQGPSTAGVTTGKLRCAVHPVPSLFPCLLSLCCMFHHQALSLSSASPHAPLASRLMPPPPILRISATQPTLQGRQWVILSGCKGGSGA